VSAWPGRRAGSESDAWRRRDYAVTPALRAAASVVAVAQRLPERVVQEDADLLMVYDNASMRLEGRLSIGGEDPLRPRDRVYPICWHTLRV
jgi:hypothetical protein